MNKLTQTICIGLSVLLLASCTRDTENALPREQEEYLISRMSVRSFTAKEGAIGDYSFRWDDGDMIGIFPHLFSGSASQTLPQLPQKIFNQEQSMSYFKGTGWGLFTDGRYQYVSYFPYGEDSSHDKISVNYHTQVQAENGSTAHIKPFDFMVSVPDIPESPMETEFEMQHLGALSKFIITVPQEWKNKEFIKLNVHLEDKEFVKDATYGIASVCKGGMPDYENITYTESMPLLLEDIKPSADGKLTLYLINIPVALEGKKLMVDMFSKGPEYAVMRDTLNCTESQQAGHMYTYEFSVKEDKPRGIFPERPKEGQKLRILLVGHSYGVDATEYIPHLLKAAGITDVYWGRFYYPNCDLKRHYEYCISDTKYTYYYNDSGAAKWSSASKNLKEVLAEQDWDVVFFQQSIAYEGAGDYSTYQPYLNALITIASEEIIAHHSKVPFLGWHLFWGYGNKHSDMFAAIRNGTKQMAAETGIKIIVPTGEAVELAMADESLSGEIYGDGLHNSLGVGRYLSACTWIEYFFKPIYGVNIIGNTFRVPERLSGESDAPTSRKFYPVDDGKAGKLQKIATEAATIPFPGDK